MQVRNSQGLISAPYIIVTSSTEQVNPMPATTVDAAKFGNIAAPEAIVAAFGSRLATQAVGATSLPLPISLDGTTVYVDGVAAGLLYVSGGQANYVIPSSTSFGPADVVVVAKDGTVSRGKVNVAGSIPAIFTRRGDGTGAPAGLASKDGQNFDILLSNADGSPVPIDAGNYVALFGTGLRFSYTSMKITIGGMEIEPLFFGPQGFFWIGQAGSSQPPVQYGERQRPESPGKSALTRLRSLTLPVLHRRPSSYNEKNYSHRSAIIGSTRAARRAGK